MKDILGQVLSVGDLVVCVRKNYRDLVKARIKTFTPQKVKVEYKLHYGVDSYEEYLVWPSDVVRQPQEMQPQK